MGEASRIEWTDHSRGLWQGCEKISPACDSCYAEIDSRRFGVGWGPDVPRKLLRVENWQRDFRKWNRAAAALGERHTVFINHYADFCEDRPEFEPIRAAFWDFVPSCPNLIFLILTKRPANLRRFLPWHATGADAPHNVWVGVTAENQEWADIRIPKLLEVRAAVRFVSCEPLLGPVDLTPWLYGVCAEHDIEFGGDGIETCRGHDGAWEPSRIGWVIDGGESTSKARITEVAWFRALREQCAAAGVPYHHKQNGEFLSFDPGYPGVCGNRLRTDGKDRAFVRGPDGLLYARVGKKLAGRMLDGRTWDEVPR